MLVRKESEAVGRAGAGERTGGKRPQAKIGIEKGEKR